MFQPALVKQNSVNVKNRIKVTVCNRNFATVNKPIASYKEM